MTAAAKEINGPVRREGSEVRAEASPWASFYLGFHKKVPTRSLGLPPLNHLMEKRPYIIPTAYVIVTSGPAS